jgi:dTDP-4-dehydrorhamnose reductase
MTERPFVHKKAFANVKNSFLYHDEVVKILFKLIKNKGIINVGGNVKNIYDFAKKDNPKVKKTFLKKKTNLDMPINSSVNILKLKKILKKK